jgi:hypothetical protein
MWFTLDGQAMHAERQPRRNFGQCRGRALPAGQAVGQDADVVTAFGLPIGEVDNMTKDAADRCAYCMKNPQRLV